MVRLKLGLFFAGVLCLPAAMADDKPKSDADDPIASALKLAKEEYLSSIEKSNENLLAAFAERQKRLEENTKLKVDQQIKLVEQIQEEKKAFEADSTRLPKSPGMKVAVSDYLAQLTAARKRCEGAFDKAAEGYRGKKDLVTAKAVLAEKKTFLEVLPSRVPRGVADNLPGKWRVSFVGRTNNGSAINYQATWEFDKAGGVRSVEAKTIGTWAYDDSTRRVVISWDNAEKSQESFPVPLTPGGLTGHTWHGAGVKFTAEKVVSK